MALKARLMRALTSHFVDPTLLKVLRPSEVAAILGLDELDATVDEEHVVARAAENVPPPTLPEVDQSVPRRERLAAYIGDPATVN